MRKIRVSLGFELVVYTLVSLLIALGVLFGGQALSHYAINERVFTQEKILAKEKELFNDFIAYMNDNRAALTSRQDALNWLNGRDSLIVAVYNGGQPFDTGDSGILLYSNEQDAATKYELLSSEYASYWYTCPVMVKGDRMRTKTIRVMYYPMYKASVYAEYAVYGLAFAAFTAVLMLFIRKKTRYIGYLSRQLQVMEGGELGQSLTVKGSDELAALADNMDRMRLSFIDRLTHEEEMTRSSQELLTAMSHDLRTPLTALIGYIDIIESGTCSDGEQQKKYISSARKRAYQLKQMTDELFEYFLVYSSGDDKLETEECDAALTLMQLWDEASTVLEAEGFISHTDVSEQPALVNVNIMFMRRVFDNIISNIRKYADNTSPVEVKMWRSGDRYVFSVRNKTAEGIKHAESSGIGLATCKKILAAHGGEFTSRGEETYFVCEFSLAVNQ